MLLGRGEGPLAALRSAMGARRAPLWSVEAWPGSPARQYFERSVEEFAAECAAAAPSKRTAHEVMQPDVPARVVLDLDVPSRCALVKTAADLDAVQARLVEWVAARLGAAAAAEVVVMDGSRPGRVSRHVTLPLAVLPSLAHVGALVAEAVAACGPAAAEVVDANIYRAWRTLRAPYAAAVGKDGRLKPNLGGAAFDAATFERALVHPWSAAAVAAAAAAAAVEEYTPPPSMERAVSSGSGGAAGGRRRRRRDLGWTDAELTAFARAVEAWLADLREFPGSAESAAFVEDELVFAVKGILCEGRGEPHRGNRVYVHVGVPAKPAPGFAPAAPLRFPAHAACTTVGCGGKRWFLADLASVCLDAVEFDF